MAGLGAMLVVVMLGGGISAFLMLRPLREAAATRLVPVLVGTLLHHPVHVEEVQIPDWNHLVVKGLKMKVPKASSPIRALQADQVVIMPAWHLWNQGATAMLHATRIEVNGARADIRLGASSPAGRSTPSWAGPWTWPKLIVKDALLNFRSPALDIRQLQLDSRAISGQNPDTLLITGRSDQVHVDLNHVKRDFKLAFTLTWSGARIQLNNLTLTPSSFQAGTLRLSGTYHRQGAVALAMESPDYWVRTKGVVTSRRQNAWIEAHLKHLAQADWFGWLAAYNIRGEVNLQGEGQMREWDFEKAGGAVNIHWRRGRILDHAVESADIILQKKNKTWLLPSALIVQGRNRLELTDWQWAGTLKNYTRGSAWPDRISGRFSFQSDDLPHLVRLWGWRTTWSKTLPHHFSLEGRLEKNSELSATSSLVMEPGGRLDLTALRFNPWVWLDDPTHAQVQLSLDLHALALESLAGLFDRPGWYGTASGEAHFEGSLTSGALAARLEIKQPAYRLANGDVALRAEQLSTNFKGRMIHQGLAGEGRGLVEQVTLTLTPSQQVTFSAMALYWQDGRITLAPTQGRLAGGTLTLSGQAHVTAPVSLDLAVNGKNILLWRDNVTNMRSNAALTVTGPLEKLLVKGRLQITEGRYRQPMDVLSFLRQTTPSPGRVYTLFSLPGPVLGAMHFDVAIRTQNPFKVDANLVKGQLRCALTLEGTGRTPLLDGVVYVEQAETFFPAGRITINNGLLRFDPAQPGIITLALNGSGRMRGYDVNVAVSGTTAKPQIIFGSQPVLPQDQLILLVLSGQTPQQSSTRRIALQTGLNTALYLSRQALGNWLGTKSGTESLLDKIDLEMGRDISRGGQETLRLQYEIGKSVFFKDDVLNLVTERDQYDDYNAGLRLVVELE